MSDVMFAFSQANTNTLCDAVQSTTALRRAIRSELDEEVLTEIYDQKFMLTDRYAVMKRVFLAMQDNAVH